MGVQVPPSTLLGGQVTTDHRPDPRNPPALLMGDVADAWQVAPVLLGMLGSFARRDGDAASDIDAHVFAKPTRTYWSPGSASMMTVTPQPQALPLPLRYWQP